jgi:hypothetical protein
MTRVEWPTLARILAWIVAVSFVIAAVVYALFAFELLGTPPPPQEDFIQGTLDFFEFDQTLWPIDFAGTALFAVGFMALAGLGPVLGRLADPDDGRRGLVAAALLGAGGLGAASQLLWLGVKPVATSTQYCECGLLAEEIMARLMILNATGSVQSWLVSGAALVLAVGLVAAGTLGREAGMPVAWLWLSLATAAVGVVSAVLQVFCPCIFGFNFPIGALSVVLLAGILIPIWAVWLAMRASDIWTPEAEVEVEVEPA